jgi:hypothetical protein
MFVILIVTAVLVLPLWLLLTVWNRYLALNQTPLGDRFQMQVALVLTSVTTLLWFAVCAVMFFEDRSSAVKSLAPRLSPQVIGSFSLVNCLGAIVCSRLNAARARETVPLRKSITICSGVLSVLWFLLLANPH